MSSWYRVVSKNGGKTWAAWKSTGSTKASIARKKKLRFCRADQRGQLCGTRNHRAGQSEEVLTTRVNFDPPCAFHPSTRVLSFRAFHSSRIEHEGWDPKPATPATSRSANDTSTGVARDRSGGARLPAIGGGSVCTTYLVDSSTVIERQVRQ